MIMILILYYDMVIRMIIIYIDNDMIIMIMK